MKPSLLFRTIFCSALFMSGCSDNKGTPVVPPPDGAEFSENLVQVYIEPDRLQAQAPAGYNHIPGSFLIRLHFYGREIAQNPDNEEFIALSRKYGDTSYNKKIVPFYNRSLLPEFSSVEVTCDRAIDSRHPAGASLADLVKLCAASPYRFIRSGYKDEKELPQFFIDHNLNITHPGYDAVFDTLDRLAADDLKLLAPSCYLHFEQRPAPGNYTFKITFRFAEGSITTEHATRIE